MNRGPLAVLGGPYTKARLGYVGDFNQGLLIPNTSKIPETFDDAFIEVTGLANGSENVPGTQFLGDADMNDFRDHWFENAGAPGSNYFYLLGAQDEATNTFLGLTEPARDWSYIFVSKIERDIKDAIRLVNHELVHQWDDPTIQDPNLGHDDEPAHDGFGFCLMNADVGSLNHRYELGIHHLYKLRDAVDNV